LIIDEPSSNDVLAGRGKVFIDSVTKK
jgi:hypothetical protein